MSDTLPRNLREALEEVGQWEGLNRVYWWRRASMQKLALMGLVEEYRPPSMDRSRAKQLPYRITASGRKMLGTPA